MYSGAASALPDELVAGMEASDIEWIEDEAARYQAARSLSPEEARQLVHQLAMVRRFEVLERQEPLAPEEQP